MHTEEKGKGAETRKRQLKQSLICNVQYFAALEAGQSRGSHEIDI